RRHTRFSRDWSSDVCSSDLNFTGIKNRVTELVTANTDIPSGNSVASVGRSLGTFKLLRWAGVNPDNGNPMWLTADGVRKTYNPEIGRASCRERVLIVVVDRS